MSDKSMNLNEIAIRIRAYSMRFEQSQGINKPEPPWMITPYYYPDTWATGRYVMVRFRRNHGVYALPRAKALTYLAWLDAGNTGTYYKMKAKEQANADG